MTDLQRRIRALQSKHALELAPLRRELAEQRRLEKQRRSKAERPKAGRKARTRVVDPGYEMFAAQENNCWACGRTRMDKPNYWGAPFLLERAHVCNKPRVEDCRVCVVLCSLCHRISHGDTFTYCELPPLTKAHLLWIKRDRGGYDAAFLAKHNVGALPEPMELPPEYIASQRRFA